SVEERRDILRRLTGLFPGRPKEELEAWLGPVDAQTAGEPLLNWLETVHEEESKRAEPVSVVVGGKAPAMEIAAPTNGGQVVSVSGPPGSGDTKVLVHTGETKTAPASDVAVRR